MVYFSKIYLMPTSPSLMLFKRPIAWRNFKPGVELSPVNRVENFCDYMDDFNPGVETLY